MCLPVAKLKQSTALAANRREINARSRGFTEALNRILLLWAEREVRDAVRGLQGTYAKGWAHPTGFAKAAPGKEGIKRQLLALYRQFGLRQMNEGGKRGARRGGGSWVMTPELAAQFNDQMETKVVLLIEETDARVRQTVKDLVSDALRESPRPSQGELGRRIARSFMGPPSTRSEAARERQAAWPGRGTDEELRVTADWARRERGLQAGDREYIFNFTRAQTIARTELSQAENAGIARGYEVAGVDWVEWLAFRNDGRSAKRQHWKMNKHPPITVAASMGADRDQWFKLPSGIMTPWPNWIGLPAGEAVNCR